MKKIKEIETEIMIKTNQAFLIGFNGFFPVEKKPWHSSNQQMLAFMKQKEFIFSDLIAIRTIECEIFFNQNKFQPLFI